MNRSVNFSFLARFELVVLLSLAVAVLSSCATSSTSTGLLTQFDQQEALPPGIPSRVGVVPFEGDASIKLQATDQFTSGLPTLGFEVVERSQIEAVLDELEVQHANLQERTMREHLASSLDLQGIFLGSITGESSPTWVDSHLNIRLISIDTGSVLWAAEAHDPRSVGWSMDVRTSAVYTVRKALELLRKDLNQERPGG